MQIRLLNLSVFVGSALVLAALPMPQANAVTRGPTATAGYYCNAALPIYDTNARTRPLAFQNEGATTIFVTCSLPGDIFGTSNTQVTVYFVNYSGASVDISCTLVNGWTGTGTPITYHPKTFTVPFDEVSGAKNWFVSDLQPTPSKWASLSCALPPSTGIATLYNIFTVPEVDS